jgi:hypothetical protein
MSDRTVNGPPLKSEFTVVSDAGDGAGAGVSASDSVVLRLESFCSALTTFTDFLKLDVHCLRGNADTSDGTDVFEECNHDVEVAPAMVPIQNQWIIIQQQVCLN